jgi:hypothetical protein
MQQGSLDYFGDVFGDGQMHPIVNNFAATYCDGRVHQLKAFINSPTTSGGSGLGYATVWIDGVLKGTGTSSTWSGAPAGTIAIIQLFETVNNTVGGVREVDRVSISDKDIPPLP